MSMIIDCLNVVFLWFTLTLMMTGVVQ